MKMQKCAFRSCFSGLRRKLEGHFELGFVVLGSKPRTPDLIWIGLRGFGARTSNPSRATSNPKPKPRNPSPEPRTPATEPRTLSRNSGTHQNRRPSVALPRASDGEALPLPSPLCWTLLADTPPLGNPDGSFMISCPRSPSYQGG